MAILKYILDLRISDIPLHVAYIAVTALIGYCISMILIGVPCSIWEAITKKKINNKTQDKIIRIFAICIFVLLLVLLFNQLASKP